MINRSVERLEQVGSRSIGAIVLAGGRAERLGGASKPLLVVDGMRLLDRAIIAAVDAGSEPITVVGDAVEAPDGVRFTREDPPFGGPVAGIAAALDDWHALGAGPRWTLVIPADVPRLVEAVRLLLAAASGLDGARLVDGRGRHRLVVLVRTTALLDRLAELPDHGRDAGITALLTGLALADVADPDALADDVDTWQDLDRARSATRQEGDAPMSETNEALDAWVAALRERYDLAEGDVPVDALLALAGDAAHGIVRPSAPLTTYVAGLLAGRDGADAARVRAIVEELAVLARGGGA